METDGLVDCLGEREVDVPVGHGVSRRQMRPVWVINGKGARSRLRSVRSKPPE
jgi:hypothetical protein